jgi:hypothetical protein
MEGIKMEGIKMEQTENYALISDIAHDLSNIASCIDKLIHMEEIIDIKIDLDNALMEETITKDCEVRTELVTVFNKLMLTKFSMLQSYIKELKRDK